MKAKRKKVNRYVVAMMILVPVLIFSENAYASQITAGNVIDMVNQSRKTEGILPVSQNETLSQVAAEKLNDMVANNYFAHNSPSGLSPWFWFEKNGYDYKFAGENLAINFTTSEDQHRAWMASPTHRKNILNPKYHEIGVAVAAGEINGQTSIIAVQEFGTLMSAGDIPATKQTEEGNLKDEMGPDPGKPTVLSVKDMMNDENLKVPQEQADKEVFSNFNPDRYELAILGFYLSLILFILSVIVSPVIVLAYSIERALNSMRTRAKLGAA